MGGAIEWFQAELMPVLHQKTEQLFEAQWRKKRGQWWRGGCPLHGGRDPNFSLNVNTLRWQCFSQCGKGGPVEFFAIQNGWNVEDRLRGPDWLDWMERLANYFGLVVPSDYKSFRAFDFHRHEDTGAIPSYAPRSIVAPDDVVGFWEMLVPVTECYRSSEYLRFRGLDPDEVADHDLARAWPDWLDAPAWAGFEKADGVSVTLWRETNNRLVLPTYNPRGEMADLRFRNVSLDRLPGATWPPKSAGRSTGLLFMDEDVQHAMGAELDEEAEPLNLVVVEGEIDFLSWLLHGRRNGYPYSTMGLVAGSVTKELAYRIPHGTHIRFDGHDDGASGKYFRRFLKAIAPRLRSGGVAMGFEGVAIENEGETNERKQQRRQGET